MKRYFFFAIDMDKGFGESLTIILLVLAATRGLAAGVRNIRSAVTDNTVYVNMVQNANYGDGSNITNTVLMRYPCGRIGLWSVNQGEFADVVTRGLILYPCIDTITVKDNSDWRSGFSGDPSMMTVTYKTNVPAKGSSVDLTVTPNVSVCRYHFAPSSRYSAVVFKVGPTSIDNGEDWKNESFTRIDDRTAEVTLSNGRVTAYFYVKLSVPCTGYGTMDRLGVGEGSSSISGAQVEGYFKFSPGTSEVIVSVAMSMTSMGKAESNFNAEFGSMDFERAVSKLKQAWIDKLGKVEVHSSDTGVLKEFYTALYTLYVNMLDATDQPFYKPYNCKRLLTIGSSDYWQYVNGYARCEWDLSRQVYPFLALVDPDAYRDNINTVQAQFDRDGEFFGNWHVFAGSGDGSLEYLGHEAVLAYLLGIPNGAHGIDYRKLLNSLKLQMPNYKKAFWKYGYIPIEFATTDHPTSLSLEQYASLKGIGIFAKLLGDTAAYNQLYPYYRKYTSLWNYNASRFFGKDTSGEIIDRGYFEGNGFSYRFMVPQDPYGLLKLYGIENAVSLIYSFVKVHDYNDYELNYEFLPIFADRADVTQYLVRKVHLHKFMDGHLTMYEGLWPSNGLNGQGAFYTDNAVSLAACILGLWYTHTSGGTFLITSPSVDSYVIHGTRELTVETTRESASSGYVGGITLDGRNYPCYQLSAITLGSANHTLKIKLVDRAVKLGDLYLSSSDGEVTACDGDSRSFLDFVINPMAESCNAEVYSTVYPDSVTRNGQMFSHWSYDSTRNIIAFNDVTPGRYRVVVSNPATNDSPTPIPSISPAPPSGISMEAENMKLTGFGVSKYPGASNGHVIEMKKGATTGYADYLFSGGDGKYDLSIEYFEMGNTKCLHRIYVGRAVADEWTSSGNGANADTLLPLRRTIKDVSIYNGTQIRLEVVGNDDRCGLYDRIEARPAGSRQGSYEMENGALIGSATTTSCPAASFGSYVGFMHITGASVTVNGVDGGKGGEKVLNVRYATKAQGATIDLYVNGSFCQTLAFNSTGGWENFRTMSTKIVLNPGPVNDIRFVHNGHNRYGVNLDEIRLR